MVIPIHGTTKITRFALMAWHKLGLSLFFLGILLLGFGILEESNITIKIILILIGVKLIILSVIYRDRLKLR